MLGAAPGRPTLVHILRGGHEKDISLDVKPLPRVTVDPAEQVWRTLGLKTTPVSPEYVVAASPKLRGGLYVQAVSPGSAGDQAHIEKGDILVGMNAGARHWETIRPDNILFILRQPETAQSQSLQFYIVRRNGIHQGVMSLAEVPSLATMSR
jgi:serine protease Do